jgi:hypothetical protein
MKPVHFDPEKDRAPLPFDDRICRQALQMKAAGLKWRPRSSNLAAASRSRIPSDLFFPENRKEMFRMACNQTRGIA